MTSQQPAVEVVVARLRPHARAMFWPTVGLFAIIGLASYFGGSFDKPWINVLIFAAAPLLAFFVWLAPLLTWLGHNYTITSRRVVVRSGLLVRVRQEMLHSRGYDVTVRKTALQSMFGSGDVEINSGLESPLVLRDVPDADLVLDALHDLMEAGLQPLQRRQQDETTSF